MKKLILIIGILLLGAGGYYFYTHPNIVPLKIRNFLMFDNFGQSSNSQKNYFYYYKNQKIYLNLIGMKNGHSIFVTKDNPKGSEMTLRDIFMVKLNQGTSLEQLETLNRANGVEIVQKLGLTGEAYTLTVTESSKYNALDMANMYYEKNLFEWSEPDFSFQNVGL